MTKSNAGRPIRRPPARVNRALRILLRILEPLGVILKWAINVLIALFDNTLKQLTRSKPRRYPR